MYDYPNTFFYRMRYFYGGLLIIAGLIVLAYLISYLGDNRAQAQINNQNSVINTQDDANIVADGFFSALNVVSNSVDSVVVASTNTADSVASATSHGSGVVAHAAQTSTVAIAHGVGKSFSFAFSIPSDIVGFVSNNSVADAIIKPSDNENVPIINPNAPELLAAIAALPATNAPKKDSTQSNLGPQWPIHGYITEEFGVPHMPYQVVHTGIDISDGQARGVTPVMPFRPGKVIEAVHSSYGFGNHVIIDHGNGVTSLYGHLNSITVQVGQQVDTSTMLGYEGTTGLSTGVHVHFEIRINGQAANPHQFVTGHP